jgi:hypothetical protein
LYLLDFNKYAYFGKYLEGSSNYFKLNKKHDGWDIIPWGSSRWDGLDQQATFGHNIDEEIIDPQRIPMWLPPPPTLEEVKAVPPMKWEDNFKGKGIYPADEFPHLKEYFEKKNINEKKLYFALVEDMYETYHGDGTFRYFKKCSFNKEDIEKFISELRPHTPKVSGYEGYFKEHTIHFNGKNFTMPDFKPVVFENYELEKLLIISDEKFNPMLTKYFKDTKKLKNNLALKSDGKLFIYFNEKDGKWVHKWYEITNEEDKMKLLAEINNGEYCQYTPTEWDGRILKDE